MLIKIVNHQNSAGSTPLHWAVVNDHSNTVELLLELGADP
jgi:ankyrin repeat protein